MEVALLSGVQAKKARHMTSGSDQSGKMAGAQNGAALAALMAAVAQRRDKSAFARLYGHFAPRLKSFLLKAGMDDGSAEELAQETMITVWRKAEQFDPKKAAVSTWIFTIARNRRIDLLRREARPEPDAEELARHQDAPAQPDDILDEAVTGAAVRAALSGLPDQQREVLELSFYGELSHGLIAEKLNVPLGTVKSRIRLALTRLRGELQDEFA